MVCSVHHTVCGKTSRLFSMRNFASWIRKSVHSVTSSLVWSLHKRLKQVQGLLFLFPFLSGLVVSSRKTNVSASNSAKHHQQRSLCQPGHSHEWRYVCPKTMMTLWFQTEAKICHLFVMGTWISVLGLTFLPDGWDWQIFPQKKKTVFGVERRSSLFPVPWAGDIARSFMHSSFLPSHCTAKSGLHFTTQIWQTKWD